MSAKKPSDVTEFHPGQWICMTPVLRDHICSRPAEVIRRSGKRVYFKDRHGEDAGQYCALSSVLALCSTKEEADELFAISNQQYDSLNSVRKDCLRRFEAVTGLVK